MFLKLITNENKAVFINSNEIRKFELRENNLTVLDLKYGTLLVKQRPEEIMEMLKGSN